MSLNNLDSRRALRSVVFAVVILVMVGFAWWFASDLRTEDGLREVIRWAFIIILVGTSGYVMEAGLRTFTAKSSFGEINMTNEDDDKQEEK